MSTHLPAELPHDLNFCSVSGLFGVVNKIIEKIIPMSSLLAVYQDFFANARQNNLIPAILTHIGVFVQDFRILEFPFLFHPVYINIVTSRLSMSG